MAFTAVIILLFAGMLGSTEWSLCRINNYFLIIFNNLFIFACWFKMAIG
jgi:hypothetical protein